MKYHLSEETKERYRLMEQLLNDNNPLKMEYKFLNFLRDNWTTNHKKFVRNINRFLSDNPRLPKGLIDSAIKPLMRAKDIQKTAIALMENNDEFVRNASEARRTNHHGLIKHNGRFWYLRLDSDSPLNTENPYTEDEEKLLKHDIVYLWSKGDLTTNDIVQIQLFNEFGFTGINSAVFID